MAGDTTGVRITFLTDIVTPYMVVALDALARVADLTVLFCSQTGTRGMDWHIDLPFRHKVIGGLTISRDDATDFYLSPRIAGALLRSRPQAIISGGFSVPSLYAALYGRGAASHCSFTATGALNTSPSSACRIASLAKSSIVSPGAPWQQRAGRPALR